MVEMRMAQDNQEYPKSYFYLMGHAFGENDGVNDPQYTIEPLGRFGTPTEAEAHIDIINQDIKKEGGILANDSEFPFLIMEVVNVIVDEGDSISRGETYKFFIYDWEHKVYTDIGQISRIDCLGEYQDRIVKFIHIQRKRWESYNSTAVDNLDDGELYLDEFLKG